MRAIQFWYLARRSTLRILRQPRLMTAPILTPMLLFLIISGGLQRASSIPNFPTASYTDFIFAFPFVQGIALAAALTGTDLARDIQMGFFRRFLLTPAEGVTILAGHLAGVISFGIFQITIYLIVGFLNGVHIKSGIAGILVLYILDLLIMLGVSGAVAYIALRTGSAEAVQALFPLLLGMVFLSSINMPRDLIQVDWFKTIVTYNPMSYLVEAIRSLIITGWDWKALGLGFGIATLQASITLTLATRAVRQRAVRT